MIVRGEERTENLTQRRKGKSGDCADFRTPTYHSDRLKRKPLLSGDGYQVTGAVSVSEIICVICVICGSKFSSAVLRVPSPSAVEVFGSFRV